MFNSSRVDLEKWSGVNLRLTWEEYLAKSFENLTDDEVRYIIKYKEIRFSEDNIFLFCDKIKSLVRFMRILKDNIPSWVWVAILRHYHLTEILMEEIDAFPYFNGKSEELSKNKSLPLSYLENPDKLKNLNYYWLLRNDSVPDSVFKNNYKQFVDSHNFFSFCCARPWDWEFITELLTIQNEFGIMDLDERLVRISSLEKIDKEVLENLKLIVELKK